MHELSYAEPMDTTKKAMHLHQFTVTNYRSIREPVTLSMVASPKHELDTDFASSATDDRLLKSAIIYGPNASGKSNVVRALFLMRRTIIGSNRLFDDPSDGADPIETFRLDYQSPKQDSSFEVTFEYDNYLFVYGFAANATDREVTGEWLKFSTLKQPNLKQVFTRSRATVKINRNVPLSLHGISKSYTKQVASQELFITSLSRIANKTMAHRVVEAWRNTHILNTVVHDPLQLIHEKPELKQELLPLLAEADFGITDIKSKIDESGDLIIEMQHTVRVKGTIKTEWFSLAHQESEGTRKFLKFAILLLLGLDSGTLIVLDELGSMLHPSLLHHVIQLFHNPSTNPHNAQLILTVHDTSLMKNLFSRDQIYFTEKTPQFTTDLYSLSDIKNVRPNTPNLDERYLRGDFGATPDIMSNGD